MTQSTGDTDILQAFRARNTLVRTVRTMLKGTGLDIRELANELVISHPGHPEYGRIYITYVRGEVSHCRTVWDYLGRFNGNASTDPEAEPCVDVHAIVTTLTRSYDLQRLGRSPA
jgi:hypothetical protein